MFGIVLLSVITLMLAYVAWRAASVPFVKRRFPVKFLMMAAVLVWALILSGRLIGRGGSGWLAESSELAGMDTMAVLFLATVCFLVVDLITAFGFLLPRLAPALRGLALVACLALSAVAVFQGMRPPVVDSFEVDLPGLPPDRDGTVVVAVSDLHLGTLIGDRWLLAREAQVRAQKPDMVLLLGDIFDSGGGPNKQFLATLARISAPLGVWAVTGNHELYGRRKDGSTILDDTSFQVLHDRWAEACPGLIVAGVDDLTARRRYGLDSDPVRKALEGRPAGATLFLSHTPWKAEEAAGLGASLMLAAHTHGGQIWPFNFLVRLSYPLVEGRYDVNGMPVIVCRGTGTWGPRMRLWKPGEILRITLRAPRK